MKMIDFDNTHIYILAENLRSSEEEMAQSASMELIQQLIEATQPQNQSLLPNDLQITSRVLSIVVEVLNNNNITNEVLYSHTGMHVYVVYTQSSWNKACPMISYNIQ